MTRHKKLAATLDQAPFKVGDQETTDFFEREAKVVRTVTAIRESGRCQSGWMVGVKPWPGQCGELDSDWFRHSSQEQET